MTGRTVAMISTMIATVLLFRFGIPYLQKRFSRPVWEYEPSTRLDVLLRHHRIAVNAVYFLLFIVAGFVSSLIPFLLLKDPFHGIVTALFCILLLPAALGGILGPLWVEEVERAMKRRGVSPPKHRDIAGRAKKTTTQMFIWIVAGIISPWIRDLIRHIWHP